MRQGWSQSLILPGILFFFFLPVLLYPQTLNIPPRPPNALKGKDVATIIWSLSLTEREQNIYNQVAQGNIPDFYRNPCPVTVKATIDAKERTALYYVIPDYLAMGSDDDYFLIPMTPGLAQQIADLTGALLPTRKMVNDIWSQAALKLAPAPIPPSSEMTLVKVFDQHNTMVWNQRSAQLGAYPLGSLVGGDKKDVVITPLMHTYPPPARVAIYGWHQMNGAPIQPLSLVHNSTYADYSHGIRLVSQSMKIDNNPGTIAEALNDSSLCVLLSDEGVISNPRYPASPSPLVLPFEDFFPSTGRQLSAWIDKFTHPVVTSFSPSSPGGDGYVLVVKDPGGGVETTRIGHVSDTDYYVQCDIYCDYRPEIAADGFERAGIFIRDGGRAVFEHTIEGGGNCYGFAWDSNNGRVWCFKCDDGALTDLNSSPVYKPSSGWRTFRINANGDRLTFILNGEVVLETQDTRFRYGQCGIGYHEYFTNNANMKGAYADNFHAGRLFSETTPTPTQTPAPTSTPTSTPTGIPTATPTATPSPTPMQANLVLNGSFEDGFTGGVGNNWHAWEDAASNMIVYGNASLNKHDGSYSQYWSRNDTAIFKGGVWQKIPVTVGRRYQLSAWMKRQSLFEGTFLEFGYDLSGGTDGMAPSVVYTDMAGQEDNVWREYNVPVTAMGSYITLFARAGHSGTTGGDKAYFYLDQVSMVDSGLGMTPTPNSIMIY
jgi:hypothetical protein